MTLTQLKSITRIVLRRAQRQGYVSEKDVRAELKQAGLPGKLWKDVITEAGGELTYHEDHYRYVTPDPGVQEEHRHQLAVGRVVRRLAREHRKSADQHERRREGRVDFIQPVTVQTEDGRTFTLLSRDISPTGIRLIGGRTFLGQKVRVTVPAGPAGTTACFLVRILWICTVGDQLFENGGAFLELVHEPAAPAAANGVHAH